MLLIDLLLTVVRLILLIAITTINRLLILQILLKDYPLPLGIKFGQ